MGVDDGRQIFISYSTKNSDLAQFFCNQLEGMDASCWIAPRNIPSGEDWAEAIVKGIEEANVVALLVSEASVSSPEVAKEIDLANQKRSTTILPIRIENVTLNGALRYHLSNKQWIDALDGDQQSRFADAVEAIRTLVKTETRQKKVAEGSVVAQARALVAQLNREHSTALSKINALFSLKERGKHAVSLFFPVRVGATGVDLLFEFHGEDNSIEIYADASVDADPLRAPFADLIKKSFHKFFPKLDYKSSSRRWRFIELLPPTELATRLVALPPERAFEAFQENINAFSEKVLPRIFEWADYAHQVVGAIKKLEAKLKEVFPEQEGWCVGAPEWEHLAGLRPKGKINVYKEAWQPKEDNYRARGYLSITLESSGAFLNNLYIGIHKSESWLDLGEWKQRLLDEGCKVLNATGRPEDWWPLWQNLEGEWKDSGIAQAELPWKDRLDELIDYCLDKFRALKGLERCLDDACAAIPDLQIKEPETFPPEQQQSWGSSHLYIMNRTRKIVETLQAKVDAQQQSSGLRVSYQIRERQPHQILLSVKVGNFDAAVAFRFNNNWRAVEIKNLEPPDFETPIIHEYLKRSFAGLTCDSISVDREFDGGSLSEWMDKVQTFVQEQADRFAPLLLSLKSHLTSTVALDRFAQEQIATALPTEKEWVVENEAESLEKSRPIRIYRKTWCNKARPDELPPFMFQIIPESPCFDDLHLTLVDTSTYATPDMQRVTGMLCGACDFAFGKSEAANGREVWNRKLDEPFHKTGGRWFEKQLLENDQKTSFGEYLRAIAGKIEHMDPILSELCSRRHEHSNRTMIADFWDELHIRMQKAFPVAQWEITYSKDEEDCAEIAKPEWNSMVTIGFYDLFSHPWIGVWCDSDDKAILRGYNDIANELKPSDPRMRRESPSWPGYWHVSADFRKPEGLQLILPEKRASLVDEYLEMLNDMVKRATPVIERFLARVGEQPPTTGKEGVNGDLPNEPKSPVANL